MPIRYLSERVLEQLDIATASTVDAIEKAIRDTAERRAWTAPKSVVLPEDGRYVMTTLAASDEPPYVAVKAVVLNPHNAARGLPSIDGVVTLLDGQSGSPVGLVDGRWVTAVRTAALSLVAARYLARRDSAVAAFLGCGVQARAHLSALADVYPLTTVLLVGRGRAGIDRMTALARSLGLTVREAEVGEALGTADLIISSLTRDPGREPFLDARAVGPGAFATITDLAEPWRQDGLGAFDRIVIDDAEQERAAAVKLADPALVRGDLTDLVLRRVDGRRRDDERTAFVFRGLGLADLAVAGLALETAERANAGQVIGDG